MTTHFSSRTTLVFGLALLAGIASAGEVTLVGSTLGSFNGNPFTPTGSLLGLSYSNSTFNNTTTGNMLDLGGNPSPGSNFNNLGSFALDNVDHNYNGNTFQVKVTFTAPFTISGGSTTTFNDIITGTVTNGNGGVFIDFDNTPQTFNYLNGSESGSFTMAINDLSIAPNQLGSVTAHVTGFSQPVPEPVSITGILCGAIGLIRRKRMTKVA
ncbi:MAG: hypothetical protein WCK51_09770 [Armatimonadota bacterium]